MSEKQETIFVDGMSVFLPQANAPEYVMGRLSIDAKTLVAFMQEHTEYLREYMDKNAGVRRKVFYIDLKTGQSGRPYASLDTWKPNA